MEARVKASTASQRDSLRAAIILRRAEGIKQAQVARELGVSVACVNKWSQRFERDGLDGLQDAKGRGRPPSLAADQVEQVITGATQPPTPRTRWTVRTMAKAVGMSPDSVHRIWKANDIKPQMNNVAIVICSDGSCWMNSDPGHPREWREITPIRGCKA